MSAASLEKFGDRMIKLVPKLKAELCRYEITLLNRRDITPTQLLVLECVAACGECKMHTLVDALNIKFSAGTALIDRLVKIGFVVRRHGKEDRRTVFVALTPKGQKILKEVYNQRRKGIIQTFSRISEQEREEYLVILEKLAGCIACPHTTERKKSV